MKQSLVSGLALLAMVSSAQATLMLSADINGTTFNCADQAGCDTNLAVGQLAIGDQTIAGVQFLGSAQTQVIGPTNSLNTSSFQVINNNLTPVVIEIAVSGTDFTGPVEDFSASGSGTFQSAIASDVDLTFFGDPTNTQGATTPTDLPGTKLADSGLITATLLTDSFNFNTSGPFSAIGPYSMSLGTAGTLVAGGSLVGRSEAIVAQQVVSEPTSLALFGASLLAFGLIRRRQHEG